MMITREELVEFDCGAFSKWARKYGPPAGTYRQWWRITPKKLRRELAYFATASRGPRWAPAEVLRRKVPFWVRETVAAQRQLPFRLRWRLVRDPDPVVRASNAHAWAAWGEDMPWKMAKLLLSDPSPYVRFATLTSRDTLPGAWADKLMRDPNPATRRLAARFTPTSERRKRI